MYHLMSINIVVPLVKPTEWLIAISIIIVFYLACISCIFLTSLLVMSLTSILKLFTGTTICSSTIVCLVESPVPPHISIRPPLNGSKVLQSRLPMVNIGIRRSVFSLPSFSPLIQQTQRHVHCNVTFHSFLSEVLLKRSKTLTFWHLFLPSCPHRFSSSHSPPHAISFASGPPVLLILLFSSGSTIILLSFLVSIFLAEQKRREGREWRVEKGRKSEPNR